MRSKQNYGLHGLLMSLMWSDIKFFVTILYNINSGWKLTSIYCTFLLFNLFFSFPFPYDLSETNTPSQCLFVIFCLYCIALSFVNKEHEMKRSGGVQCKFDS